MKRSERRQSAWTRRPPHGGAGRRAGRRTALVALALWSAATDARAQGQSSLRAVAQFSSYIDDLPIMPGLAENDRGLRLRPVPGRTAGRGSAGRRGRSRRWCAASTPPPCPSSAGSAADDEPYVYQRGRERLIFLVEPRRDRAGRNLRGLEAVFVDHAGPAADDDGATMSDPSTGEVAGEPDHPYDCLRLERAGAVVLVRLHRPDALNALSDRLMDELTAVLDALRGRRRCAGHRADRLGQGLRGRGRHQGDGGPGSTPRPIGATSSPATGSGSPAAASR